MTLNQLLIASVVVENRPVRDVAAQYGVSQSWLFELVARYKAEGEAAFEPRSRRPKTVPRTTPAEVVDLILEYREKLNATGLDAGPDTIRWHLEHHHSIAVSRATISRYLAKAGLVVPAPKKKPKSSYIRFQAEMPNETWQADFTHYGLRRPDPETRYVDQDELVVVGSYRVLSGVRQVVVAPRRNCCPQPDGPPRIDSHMTENGSPSPRSPA